MNYNIKRAKLATIKDYLTICLNDENKRHTKAVEQLENMKNVYDEAYLKDLSGKENKQYKENIRNCYTNAVATLDELYNIIISEQPNIFHQNFQYAKEIAQLLGDKMTIEQATTALEPLRGQITSLDILRTVYERAAAPVEPFDNLTFYKAATDIQPEADIKETFQEVKNSLLKLDDIGARYGLRQIANKLLDGNMNFMPDNNTTTEMPAIL